MMFSMFLKVQQTISSTVIADIGFGMNKKKRDRSLS
jgi:hypothetical protein